MAMVLFLGMSLSVFGQEASTNADPVLNGKRLSEWVKGLLSKDYETQRRTVEGLHQLSTNDYQTLVKTGRSKDCPPDPIINGKPLSEWLYNLDEKAEEKERFAAVETVKHSGTNILSSLVAMLQIKSSGLEELLISRGLLIGAASSRRYAVIDGFQLLGDQASPAIPALAELLSDDEIGYFAAMALSKIGRSCLPTLLKAITSPNTTARKRAAQALGDFSEDSEKVIPALLKGLKDEEVDVCAYAADSLRLIKKTPAIVVPALIESMADTNNFVRFHIATALGVFGKDATTAVPLLREALTNADSNVRQAAEGALLAIEGPRRK